MSFIKKQIKAKLVWVIDIWTYKVRAWVCKIKNWNVELLWYGEKRQDEDYILMQEFQNLEWISNNIKQALKKAEKDSNKEIDEIIINIPTGDMFFEFSKVNHIRESEENIDEKELKSFLKETKSKVEKKHYKSIFNNYWFKKSDLKLLISEISHILLDNQNTDTIIWNNPEQINISILNIFISRSKIETIKFIEKAIWKKVINIIPTEYAILHLFDNKKNLVLIDFWDSHLSIIVKKDGNIVWIKKLNFGINDLIKKIRKNHQIPKNNIINTIDEDIFLPEKKEFLNIFKDILVITLEEILAWEICPNKFCIVWWWANKFLKDYLEKESLSLSQLKIVWKIEYISPKIDFLDESTTKDPEWISKTKTNINIFALIKSSVSFINKNSL